MRAMRGGGAIVLAGVLAFSALRATAQEAVRIEAQSVATPAVVDFHPKNDNWLLVGDGADRVRLLDFTDPARPFVRLTLPAPAPTRFLPDGRILTGGRDGMLRVWTDTGREAVAPLKVSENPIYGLAISPSGRLIAVQDSTRTLRIVSLDSRLLPPPIVPKRTRPDAEDCSDSEFGSSTPLFSPDERVVVYVALCGYVAAVTADGKPVALDDADTAAVHSMAFSRDGKSLMVRFVHQPGATSYLWRYENGAFGPPVKVPDPLTHREFRSIVEGTGRNTFLVSLESRIQGLGADGRATDFAFDVPGARGFTANADGSRIAVSLAHSVMLFSGDGRPLAAAPFQQFVDTRGMVAVPGGDVLLAADEDGALSIWGLDGNRIGKPVRIRPAAANEEQRLWEGFHAVPSAVPGEFVVTTDDGYVSVVRRDGTRVSGPIRLPGYDEEGSAHAAPAPSATAIVAPGPGDQTLRLFDRAGRPIGRPFALHGRYIAAVGISADGAAIATVTSGTTENTFQLWSGTGQKIGDSVAFDRALTVRYLRFSPDGRSVVAWPGQGSGGFALFRRGDTAFIEPSTELFLGFLADGGVARTDRGRIVIEAADGKVRRRALYHTDYTLRTVLPDGLRTLVHDGIATRILPIEALAKPAERTSLWQAAEADFVAVAPGGDFRILFTDGRFVAMPLGQPPRIKNIGAANLQMGHSSSDGSRIALDEAPGRDRRLRILDEEGNVLAPPVEGYFVAFAPDSSRIAVGAIDDRRRSSLAVYDRNGARLWHIDLGNIDIGRIAYSQDGERVAAAIKGAIHTYDREGRPVGMPIETGIEWITALTPMPDGGWMVLTGDDTPSLHFFSAAGARIAGPVNIPASGINSARFTPDGRHILTRHESTVLRLWSLSPGGTLVPVAVQTGAPYYIRDQGIADGRIWTASRHALSWFDSLLQPLASTLLFADGHLVVLRDGRHCGAGPVFTNRRAFRGSVELTAAERDALVDCVAVRAALGGR